MLERVHASDTQYVSGSQQVTYVIEEVAGRRTQTLFASSCHPKIVTGICPSYRGLTPKNNDRMRVQLELLKTPAEVLVLFFEPQHYAATLA